MCVCVCVCARVCRRSIINLQTRTHVSIIMTCKKIIIALTTAHAHTSTAIYNYHKAHSQKVNYYPACMRQRYTSPGLLFSGGSVFELEHVASG